jgi:hypothetical protein
MLYVKIERSNGQASDFSSIDKLGFTDDFGHSIFVYVRRKRKQQD